MTEQEDAIHIFKSLESLVRLQFGDSLVCMPVYTPDDDGRFMIIYCRPSVNSDGKGDIWCGMKYLPIFYIIGIVDENLELSLKLITYHGRNVDELKLPNVSYDDNHSDYSIDKRKIEFIQRLNNLKLCQGVKFPDADIQHSLHTLSEAYLIECLENIIVLRSRHCTFAIPKDQEKEACDTCSNLSRKQSERKLKRAGKRRKNPNRYDEDDFTIFSEERNFVHPSQDDINTEYTKHEENLPNDEESEHSYLPDVYENGYTYDGGGSRDRHVLEYNDVETDYSWSLGNPILSQVNEKQELLVGTDSVHDGLVESSFPDSESTYHKCKQCSYQTLEKSELIMHISSVHRKMKQRTFKCKYCVHKTSNKSQLIRHIQDSHDPEKPYSCDSCQFKSKEKRTLVQHVVAVHDKTKSYLCEQCSYSTPSKGRLSCHIKAVHDKAKPFICELCSMALSAKAHLDNHIAVVHNKIKPFKCDQCPYRAANIRDKARHVKEVHEKVKPYMCNLCPYRAGRRTLLVKHLAKMHNETKLPTRKVKYDKEPNPNSNLGYYKNKPGYELADFKTEQIDL